MYNYNTLEGKIRRVEELRKLQVKIACVPGKHLAYSEAHAINQYLNDIAADLEKQIKEDRKKKQDMIDRKVAAVNKALFDHWGTDNAVKLWDELKKCATREEIAELYDFITNPTR